MQDLYGDLRKVSQKTQQPPVGGKTGAVAQTTSAESTGSSLAELIQIRRKKDADGAIRNVLSPQEEALLLREEELDRRELAVRQAEINLVRRIENDRRVQEDTVRWDEDERRRQEDSRRALEDERRREEEERRKLEDDDVLKIQGKIKQHESRKVKQQERIKMNEIEAVLSLRRRQLEDMLVYHQTQDPTVVDFALFLMDRIDAVVSQNSDVSDLDALFSLVISDGATKYSEEQKKQVLAKPPPQNPSKKVVDKVSNATPSKTLATGPPPPRGRVTSDDEDGFFMLDESPVQTKKPVVHPSSPSSSLSAAPSNRPPPPSESSKVVPEAKSVQRASSGNRSNFPGGSPPQQQQLADPESEDDEDNPDFWVMLDATDDPTIDVSQSSRLNIIKKIQRHLLGNSPRAARAPGKKRAQELPTTLSRTEAFKETRQQSTKKRLQELQSQITKLLPSTERLAESDTQFDPIANFDSWNPLKKLVISNKETWNACGECGEYFDMLSIKHNCRLCLKAVCSKCGVETKTFSPTLVGVSGHRNTTIDVKCCKSCRNALSALERQQMLQKWRSNPRFRAFTDKYEQAHRAKSKVLECVAVLDDVVAAIGPRDMPGLGLASAVPTDKLQQLSKSEKSLVLALQEYQDLVAQIGKIMESFAKPASPEASDPGVEGAEFRKLITHYKVLKQGMGVEDQNGPPKIVAPPTSVSSPQNPLQSAPSNSSAAADPGP